MDQPLQNLEPMVLGLDYWEQAANALSNLADLQCWAKMVANISKVVEPSQSPQKLLTRVCSTLHRTIYTQPDSGTCSASLTGTRGCQDGTSLLLSRQNTCNEGYCVRVDQICPVANPL